MLIFRKAFKKKKAIFINNNLSFHKRISFSRDESLFLLTSPNANVSGTGFSRNLKQIRTMLSLEIQLDEF